MRSVGGRAAVFAPLETGRRADAVVRRLADGITLGLLAPHEQLPSETELADTFGVSPVTVREALTTLREQGLVATRRGRGGGSFVRDVGDRAVTDPLHERLRAVSPSELRDLADHYVAVTGTGALLAADRAGEQDVALLAGGVAELERAADAGARRRAESRFHVELAAAAQSPRLTRAEIALQTEVGPLLWLPTATPTDQAEQVRQHAAIVDAVASGDGQRARAQAVAHVYAALARASALQLGLLGELDPDAGDPPWRSSAVPVTAPRPPEVDELAGRVTALCETTFATVDGLRGVAEQLLLPLRHGVRLATTDVAPVDGAVRQILDVARSPLVGAGLVVAPGVLADARHWMEWWFRDGPADGAGRARRLHPEFDVEEESFYDYTVLPWFAVPRETGRRHVTGPYVDWLCTQEYTLTFTAPLFGTHPELGRCHLGVVGADIVASWLERRLLPLLRRMDVPVALVNGEGRVVVANRPELVTGAVVRQVDVPALWRTEAGKTGTGSTEATLHALPDLPLGVLVLTG